MNVYAVSAHESLPSLLDLLDALWVLDPASKVLLWADAKLNDTKWLHEVHPGLVIHPDAVPISWQKQEAFVFSSLEHAFVHMSAKSVTIVDSDQMPLRSGWSEMVLGLVSEGVGLLGKDCHCVSSGADWEPVRGALAEADALWRPLLQSIFPDWNRKLWYSLQGGTVVTHHAASALLQVWRDSRFWSSIFGSQMTGPQVEVLIPTIVAAAMLPLRRYEGTEWLRWRPALTPEEAALAVRSGEWWAHPVPRRWTDPTRAELRRIRGGN